MRHPDDIPDWVYERVLDYAKLFNHPLAVTKIAEMWHVCNFDTKQILCSYTPDGTEIQDFRGVILDSKKTPVPSD